MLILLKIIISLCAEPYRRSGKLGTLENLQHDGAKTIGIISHVKELEDRISTQIQARKTGNGISVLSGAGVTQPAS